MRCTWEALERPVVAVVVEYMWHGQNDRGRGKQKNSSGTRNDVRAFFLCVGGEEGTDTVGGLLEGLI